MKIRELVAAGDIFEKYGIKVLIEGADHDIIYGPSDPHPEQGGSEQDVEGLEELGWHWDDNGLPNGYWAAFV